MKEKIKEKGLFLGDLKRLTPKEIKEHIKESYEYKHSLDNYKIIIAYESVGSWGCDSSSFFVVQDKKTFKLYEVHGGHCSCFGFEEQFELNEETNLEYLSSDNFYFHTGGYDDSSKENENQVKCFLKELYNKYNKEKTK